MKQFAEFYRHKRVLVTGHTGFKGAWLAIWLREMGAEVVGLALEPQDAQGVFSASGLGARLLADLRVDIRDGEAVKLAVQRWQPDMVFHLAAQPIVRTGYEQPVMTYETNVMGTIHVMEAIRQTPSVRVGVMITTDKCYENREQQQGYREDDAMGGYDPYSSSKGAAEIAIASWRRSFFLPADYDKHHMSLASVRAGNVIGGGDWATARIVPDCIRAIQAGQPVAIRSPRAIRPWQHVLEPLGGYLLLGQKMWEEPTAYCEGWNFGPQDEGVANVWSVASRLIAHYGEGTLVDASRPDAFHEAQLLRLDITKARERLGWTPRLTLDECLRLTAEWYRTFFEIARDAEGSAAQASADVFPPLAQDAVYALCVKQINAYLAQ